MEKNLVIHQITAGFRRGDAISDEAMLLRSIFRSNGCVSNIYCDPSTIADNVRSEGMDIQMLCKEVKPSDYVILHLSIGSVVNSVFASLNCKKVILYHNVTPPEFFTRLNPNLAQRLADGRRQVASLAGVAEINLADSAYNAAELKEMGYTGEINVLPLVIDASFGVGSPIDNGMYHRLKDDGRTNILFVGRVAPNKRHDKLIEVFSYYQHYINPKSRLIIAGSANSLEGYKALLMGAVYSLELKNVYFTDFISSTELNACYAASDLFLCMSDHEGFCAPLIEAMSWNLPVCASAKAAVPETMDGSGVLFKDASSAEIAETINEVLTNAELKNSILKKQSERLHRFRNRDVWSEICRLLKINK